MNKKHLFESTTFFLLMRSVFNMKLNAKEKSIYFNLNRYFTSKEDRLQDNLKNQYSKLPSKTLRQSQCLYCQL